jgi:hypothetical protein
VTPLAGKGVCLEDTSTHKLMHMNTYTLMHTCMNTYIHIEIYAHKFIYTCTYVHKLMYTYRLMHIHPHVRVLTHTLHEESVDVAVLFLSSSSLWQKGKKWART